MLVLTRKKDESVVIGGNIVATVVEIRGDKVRLGFNAPREVTVHRSEVQEAIGAGPERKLEIGLDEVKRWFRHLKAKSPRATRRDTLSAAVHFTLGVIAMLQAEGLHDEADAIQTQLEAMPDIGRDGECLGGPGDRDPLLEWMP